MLPSGGGGEGGEGGLVMGGTTKHACSEIDGRTVQYGVHGLGMIAMSTERYYCTRYTMYIYIVVSTK